MSMYIRNLLCALSLMVLSGCHSDSQPSIPFDLTFSKEGLLRQNFIVKEPRLYAVDLKYSFFAPSDRQDAWDFAGGADGGAPFDVTVKITSASNTANPIILDTVAKAPKLTSWGANALYAELAEVRLIPGTYILHVTLSEFSPPPGIILSSGVVIPYRGK